MTATLGNNSGNNFSPMLSVVMETIRALNEEVGRVDWGSQTILTFLAVAQSGTLPQSQLQLITGMTQAGVSRNVGRLAEYGDSYARGLGLIRSYEDPEDRKSKLLTLTPRGQEVMAVVKKRAGKYFDLAVKRATEKGGK